MDVNLMTDAMHNIEASIVRQLEVIPWLECSDERKELGLRHIEELAHSLRVPLNNPRPIVNDDTH